MFKTKKLNLVITLFIGIAILMGPNFSGSVKATGSQYDIHSKDLEADVDVQAYDVDPQPLVSITFDDYSQTVYDAAFPILQSQGIPATFYFLTSHLTGQWVTQLNNLEDSGWEIGSHTRTHPVLTALSPADLVTELSQSKAELEAAGLTVTGFEYPYGSGSRDGAVVRQVKQYYSYAQSTTPGYNSPVVQQYALKTQVQESSHTIETMRSWVDTAIANKQWLIITMHSVDYSGTPYSITPDNLSALASYIKGHVDAGNIAAVTTREGFTRYTQTYWAPIASVSQPVEHDLAISNGRLLWYFGTEVVDYVNDGYEWVRSGRVHYYEWHGDYHSADDLTEVSLQSLNAGKATVRFTLTDSTDGNFYVVSVVTLLRGGGLAKVDITDIQGMATALSLAKYTTRRFSTTDGLLVTDGSLETGLRPDWGGARSMFAFDDRTDLVRILTQPKQKTYSEYSNFEEGELRSREISKGTELPYTWCVGGATFGTLTLLSEAEAGVKTGGWSYYTGVDASPKTGNTGVVLDAHNDTVIMQFTPPYRGDYILSIRQKGDTSGDEYSYRIDGGGAVTRTVAGTGFGYENIALGDLSAQSHTVSVRQVSGSVVVDYALLIPTSRTSGSPPGVEFPGDMGCPSFIYLPITIRNN